MSVSIVPVNRVKKKSMWYSTLFFHLIFFTTFPPLRASYRCLLLEINFSLIRLFFHGIYNHICEQVSPRFFCCPTFFFLDLLEPWDVRELYIRKTADLPLQLCLGTFPRFVAIRFYFLSETLI